MSAVAIATTFVTAVVLLCFMVRPSVGVPGLIVLLPFTQFIPPIPGTDVQTAPIVVGFATVLTLVRYRLQIPPLRLTAPVVAFGLILGLGWAISVARYSEMEGFSAAATLVPVRRMMSAAAFFFLAFWWTPAKSSRLRILEAISVTVAVVAATGLIDVVGQITPSANAEQRAAGILGNPNVLCGFLAAYSLVPLYLIRRPELSRWRRFGHVLAYGLSMVTVVLTLSRGGWLAVFAAHATWFSFVNRTLLVGQLFSVLFMLTLAYPFLPETIRERAEGTFRTGSMIYRGGLASQIDSSAGARVVLYRIGFAMFSDSPLWGHGLNSVALLSPRYGARYGLLHQTDSHSLYVKVAAEHGLLGLGVLAWLASGIFAIGRRLWRSRDPDREAGALLIACGSGVMVASLFGTTFTQSVVAVYFWILLAVVMRTGLTTAGPSRPVSDRTARLASSPVPSSYTGIQERQAANGPPAPSAAGSPRYPR